MPPQRIAKADGVVEIQVIEGRVESIEVKGNSHLNADYVRNRIARFTGKPLNQQQLLTGLQLLRLPHLYLWNLRAVILRNYSTITHHRGEGECGEFVWGSFE